MPPVNQTVIASAGVIAITVAVAAAIAVYESPELRRLADDLRRRIAIALHSLGDGINPAAANSNGQPLFNRPEDAEGFLRSRGALGGHQLGLIENNASGNEDVEVDADDETRRRQREELMYWNALREQKEKEKREAAERDAVKDEESGMRSPSSTLTRGSTFDDFLKQDDSAEKGAYVYNSGTDVPRVGGGGSSAVVSSNLPQEGSGLLLRRRNDGVRGLNAATYANPFADENQILIDEDDMPSVAALAPDRYEIMSDIYNATDRDHPLSATLSPPPRFADLLSGDADEYNNNSNAASIVGYPSIPPPTMEATTATLTPAAPLPSTVERELGPDEFMTAGQPDRDAEAYASIQAWAQTASESHPPFYSPLPTASAANSVPPSEPELVSEAGDDMMTPVDSVSLASGEDIGGREDVVSRSGADDEDESGASRTGHHHTYDVMSDDEDAGMVTPASWSEVGSVISEETGPRPVRA